MSVRRRILGAVIVLVLAAIAWSVYLVWRTEHELRDAEAAADRLEAAIRASDDAARDAAISDLASSASAAKGHTDGHWWGLMSRVPVYGDDIRGVEALSASLDLVASGAAEPLSRALDGLDSVVQQGNVDIVALNRLADDVLRASDAISQADELVTAQDSAGFVDALRTRYIDYVDRVRELDDTMSGAATAAEVLPNMLGASGPRDYLLVFQNNAEIRSTGGLPGSWARVHAEDGGIEMLEQGSASDLNNGELATDLTSEEEALYGEQPALYFQDPNFIPDFPRVAEIFEAFWDRNYPDVQLDGVITIDTVALGYLLEGTGPVEADGITLTSANAVDELLNRTYLAIEDPRRQDERFQSAARAVFDKLSGGPADPTKLVESIGQSVSEGRILYAPFDARDADVLAGSSVLGAIPVDDGSTPRIFITLNDQTGSKMSYYLDFRTSLSAVSCKNSIPRFEGSLEISQKIAKYEAERLPDYVTGAGSYGIDVGTQAVNIRIYGPVDGQVESILLDGKRVEPLAIRADSRTVASIVLILDGTRTHQLSFSVTASPDQTGPLQVRTTPPLYRGFAGPQEVTQAC